MPNRLKASFRNKLLAPFILPKNLFLDYIQINYHMPTHRLSLLTYTSKHEYDIANSRPLSQSHKFLYYVRNKLFDHFRKTPGIRFHVDGIHHNLKIYFASSYFIADNLKDNILQIENDYYTINDIFNTIWFRRREWIDIPIPIPTLSRFDIAFNCHFDQKKPKFRNRLQGYRSHNLKQNGKEHFDSKCGRQWIYPPERLDLSPKEKKDLLRKEKIPEHLLDICPILISGVSVGSPTGVYLTAYDKTRDYQHKQDLAIDRFGSAGFIRKEWKVYRAWFKKSFQISTLDHFIDLIIDHKGRFTSRFTEMFKRIRLSADIILMDDNYIYKSLHDLNDDNINLLYHHSNKKIEKKVLKLLNKRAHVFKNQVPKDQITTSNWRAKSSICGTLNNHKKRMDTGDYIDIVETLKEIIYSENNSINNGHPKHIDVERIKTHWLDI